MKERYEDEGIVRFGNRKRSGNGIYDAGVFVLPQADDALGFRPLFCVEILSAFSRYVPGNCCGIRGSLSDAHRRPWDISQRRLTGARCMSEEKV